MFTRVIARAARGAAAALATAGLLAAGLAAVPASGATKPAGVTDPPGTTRDSRLAPRLAPGFATSGSILTDVSAVGGKDAWAVGTKNYDDVYGNPLAEHFDGKRWTPVGVPGGRSAGRLSGVAAVASDDVWAVGYAAVGEYATRPVVDHWDGHSWRAVHCPNPPARDGSELFAVDASSADDVWAVGETRTARSGKGFVVHWDGHTWSRVSDPVAHRSLLFSVAARSPRDVWAVGSRGYSPARPFAEHWDGRTWTRVALPAPRGGGDSAFQSVIARGRAGAGDAWVVGTHSTTRSGAAVTSFFDQWDGDHWTRVRNPNPGGPRGFTWLSDLAATGAGDVWAAGYATAHPDQSMSETLIEHWNGHRWTRVSSPNPRDASSAVLIGVATISADDALAVGEFSRDFADVNDLTERWDGTSWRLG